MLTRRSSMLIAASMCFSMLLAVQAQAQTRTECEERYKPQTGQLGKDVVWVPTNDALVTRMLKLANVKPDDIVYDLGAGDGKIAIAAAKQFGARSVGVEYNADLAQLGQCYAKAEGVADRVRIVQGDIFETDFSDATVVTLYLLPDLNMRLRPTLLAMKPGTRIVSHSFLMDDWEPDERSMTEDGHAYLWIVPADVEGTWEFRPKNGRGEPIEVAFEQKFQELSGSVGDDEALNAAELQGSQLSVTFEQQDELTKLEGRVDGGRIDARVTRNGETIEYVGRRT